MLCESVEELLEQGFDTNQIWESLNQTIASDQELDCLVGLLEDKGHEELSEEISIGLHHHSLSNTLYRLRSNWDNDISGEAHWQKPKETKELEP